jgi:hypothetical protein
VCVCVCVCAGGRMCVTFIVTRESNQIEEQENILHCLPQNQSPVGTALSGGSKQYLSEESRKKALPSDKRNRE